MGATTILDLPAELIQLILLQALTSIPPKAHAGIIAFCRRIDRVDPRMRANMRAAFTAWCSQQGLHRCKCHDRLENGALYDKFLGDLFWSRKTARCFDCGEGVEEVVGRMSGLRVQ
jgi:hypothetical protein